VLGFIITSRSHVCVNLKLIKCIIVLVCLHVTTPAIIPEASVYIPLTKCMFCVLYFNPLIKSSLAINCIRNHTFHNKMLSQKQTYPYGSSTDPNVHLLCSSAKFI